MRLLTCIIAAAIPSLASAQTLLRTVPGPAPNAQFGACSIVVSDQNGDGYKDVLVGAPGFNQERGAIYCVSGAHLATGAGTPTIWSLAPTANQGDRFGAMIADVGDVTLDGVRDYLVGQPGYDLAGANDCGAVRLVNGASRTIVSLIVGQSQGASFGSAAAATGDLDFDSRSEVLVGAPGGPASSINRIHLIRGPQLTASGSISLLGSADVTLVTGERLGASIASNFDYSNLGTFAVSRFAVGAPGYDGGAGADSGAVYFGSVTFGGANFSIDRIYPGASAGERLGASVDAAHDYDGDGETDIVVGAPDAPNGSSYQVGRAVVLSGRKLITNQPPFEVHVFPFGSVAPPVNHNDPVPNFHFGAAVRACADLNGDGVGEILVGAPDYFTQGFPSGWSFRGMARILSGSSGNALATITGSSTDRLGSSLAGAIADFDGDGFREFLTAGALSDVGGTDSGVLKCYRLWPLTPTTYCVGKVNSLGCTPAMSFTGSPSESSSAQFLVRASNLVNQKNGLLFYSYAPTVALFQGGTKCVASPTVRTPPQNSGGATTGASCTGAFSFDFNAWIQTGPDPSLSAGAEVFAQYWSRDPQSPSHTSLSNALRFVVNP